MPRSASKQSVMQPSVGDLSALQEEIKNPTSITQNVASTSANDVLEDITLLEEAFAEMEVSVADYEQEIPMLHSTVEEASSINQTEALNNEETEKEQSIPVLEQEASAFAAPATEASVTERSNIPTLETASNRESLPVVSEITSNPEEPAQEDVIIGESEPPELDVITEKTESTNIITETPETAPLEELTASELSPLSTHDAPSHIAESELVKDEPTAPVSEAIELTTGSGFSALVEDSNSIPEPLSAQSSLQISMIEEEDLAPTSPSIEEKIAQACADTKMSDFNQTSLTEHETEDSISTELAPSFAEDPAPSTPTQTPPNDPSLSIPFELHSQLSKKIDDLVLDATMSLTTELQTQLSLQLESLLGGAVEAVLPRLIDQMANELRAEVKGRVKQQLPIIVNEVLGKTRLS